MTTSTIETSEGHILEPFPPWYNARYSYQPHQSNPKEASTRKITDLSFPSDNSVNNAIDPTLCFLTYTSVDQVAMAALQLGKGCLPVKVDIKVAYRLVSVHFHVPQEEDQ